jgi:hypothetical protein
MFPALNFLKRYSLRHPHVKYKLVADPASVACFSLSSLPQIPFLAPAFCCSPSGYTQDGDRLLPCSPLTTPEVVYLFLRAGSACSQDLIDSVRSALLDFLTHPDTAFGEQCVWLHFTERVQLLVGGLELVCVSQ